MKKIIPVFLFFITSGGFSQNSLMHYEQISAAQGLSQASVKSIVQDYLGFIWFCTDDGLNRFDGYKCKVYGYNPEEPEGLQVNVITSACEDLNKNLWVGTQGGGLYKYNREKDKFIYVEIDSGRAGDYVKKIISLYSSDEYLWIGTRDRGVIKFNLETEKVENYISKDSGLSSNYISCITGDDKGNLWIGTSNSGINKLSYAQNNSFNIEIFAEDNLIFNMAVDKLGFVWFTTTTEIKKLNPSSGRIKIYNYLEKASNRLMPEGVFSLFINRENETIWAAASDGILKYNPTDDNFSFFSIDKENNPLKLILRTLYIHNNILWVGTINRGAFKINLSLEKFHNFLDKPQAGVSVPGMSILQDKNGFFWAGTFGYGLFQLDSNKSVLKNIYSGDSEKTYVFCVLEDNDGFIWYGTIFNGLFRYDKKTSITKNYNPKNSSLKSFGISCLYLDEENVMWVGTHAMGLFKYHKPTDSFIEVNSSEKEEYKISDKGITSVYSDTRGNLWIGTESSGLGRLDKKTGKFFNYRNSSKDKKSLSHNYIIVIKEDSKKNLWIGTYSGGLNKFNYETQSFKYYTINEGLVNNTVLAIEEDNKGSLWISTSNGISKFNPDKELFTSYLIPDGLTYTEFVQNSSCISKTGEITFGSIEGFTSFDPAKFSDENVDYKIVITGFKISNKPVSVGDGLKFDKSISLTDKINLNYKDNLFEFEFVALNHDVQQIIKYAYKMENFDNNWIITTPDKRFATYTNLDPGEYVFKVKVVDRSGNLSANEASVLVTISPPYWQTWWFYSLLVLLISSILYSVYKYRINKILELERLRIGIASDLHDDIGSTLTKLALKADMIQRGLDVEDKNSGLKRISEMSRQAVSTMSDIVWSIDSRNDSFECLINKMKDFSFGILTAKEIKVTFDITGFNEANKITLQFRQHLYLIFKEAVNNIAKHSNAKKVEVSFIANGNKFSLVIKDDGTGFKDKEFYVGQGLKNMKMRAEKIYSVIEYKNENGFTVCVTGKLISN